MRLGIALMTAAATVAPVAGETVVAARTLPSHHVVLDEDLHTIPSDVPGTLHDPAQAIGMETRRVIYRGQPLRHEILTKATVVERNARVTLLYVEGSLTITSEGRALDRGGAGDRIRAMNLGSRTTVVGEIRGDRTVLVNGN
ncbi:MAG: flagellar basal body P-ring formation chaperone FlgA [Pseudomonadota bacterium]